MEGTIVLPDAMAGSPRWKPTLSPARRVRHTQLRFAVVRQWPGGGDSAEAALAPGDEVTIGPYVLVGAGRPPKPAPAAIAEPAARCAASGKNSRSRSRSDARPVPSATADPASAEPAPGPTQEALQRAFVEGLGLPTSKFRAA
jgi:hypothetical protein